MDPIPVHLEAAIRTKLRERRTPGLAICCFDVERVRFAGGVGDADLGRGEPVTPTTVFRVASVSKLLTTTLVLSAVQSGSIGLDDRADQHLPAALRIRDRRGDPATSTVRSLLSHTSGLPSSTRGTDLGGRLASRIANQGKVRSLTDAISGLRLRHEPGDRIVYSNAAFNVAGYVAAAGSGLRFEDAVRQQVLSPLGMSGADFAPRRPGIGIATPYGSIFPPGVGAGSAERLRLVATPMGGLTASVLDLARFGRMVLGRGTIDGRAILDGGLVEEATTVQALNHPALEQGYGLGFKVRTWRGRTIVGHDGNMPGVATQLLLSPDDGVGVVVLTNGYSLAVPHEVADLALCEALGLSVDGGPIDPIDPIGRSGERLRREALARRVEGTWGLADPPLPGVAGRLADLMTRSRITHATGGRLRLDGNPGSDGAAWLEPLAGVGRYRVAAGVEDRTTAVVEERADGVHLWLGHATRLRRRS